MDVVLDEELFKDCFKWGFNILQPIPLTSEWLGKFGFVNHGYYLLFWDKDGIQIVGMDIKTNNGYCWNWNSSVDLNPKQHKQIDILYVHQLQNLYFALTGKELTIKQGAEI